MYKVFSVEGGYQIFWCPTEWEKIPLAKIRVYPYPSAAYRRCKQLNDAAKAIDEQVKQDGAIIV